MCSYWGGIAGGVSTKKPIIKLKVILSQSAEVVKGIGAWKATLLPAQDDSGNLNKKTIIGQPP
jgi:hypothetical protein